jgi:hypothetical protein
MTFELVIFYKNSTGCFFSEKWFGFFFKPPIHYARYLMRRFDYIDSLIILSEDCYYFFDRGLPNQYSKIKYI